MSLSKLFSWLPVSRKEWQKLDERLLDLEKQFVTRRDRTGKVTQTLADVPVSERSKIPRGASIHQRLAWLEATDGGRKEASV